ncbi:MAG TPA: FMN-binding negative transcriptional regulator [Solirubrobacteraceae bacterium]|jgi:transcriptional regulator
MRPNPLYASTDVAVVRALIEEHPWAVFVNSADGVPVASHVPILLEQGSSELAIVTHLGRPDEQQHRLGEGEALLIVQGHHGYISPSWYGPGDPGVPTWNYTVAHCYGVPEVLDEQRNFAELLRLVELMERRQGRDAEIDCERAVEIARGTVGIRMPIARFICKRKLSQNKDAETRASVIAGLRAPDGPYRNLELAQDMEQISDA